MILDAMCKKGAIKQFDYFHWKEFVNSFAFVVFFAPYKNYLDLEKDRTGSFFLKILTRIQYFSIQKFCRVLNDLFVRIYRHFNLGDLIYFFLLSLTNLIFITNNSGILNSSFYFWGLPYANILKVDLFSFIENSTINGFILFPFAFLILLFNRISKIILAFLKLVFFNKILSGFSSVGSSCSWYLISEFKSTFLNNFQLKSSNQSEFLFNSFNENYFANES